MLAVAIRNLRKSFGQTIALQDLTLEIPCGSFFGFLGANGAGKTTTIRLLTGLLHPSKGTIEIFGLDVFQKKKQAHQAVGYMPGELSLYPEVSGFRLLEVLGSFYPGTPWRKEALDFLELHAVDLARPMRECSTGTKQKIGLVQAVQHAPRLLVLDEPTKGLDPLVQQRFFTLLKSYQERGTTIFMSTHVLSEVEDACDLVGIIRAGELLSVQSLRDLRGLSAHQVRFSTADTIAVLEWREAGVEVTTHGKGNYSCEVHGDIGKVLERLSLLKVESLNCQPLSVATVLHRYYREGEV